MALLGESHFGAARGLAHVVMLTVGTGIGGALMEGGAIVRGRGTAGELGHVTVDMNGLPCVCGRRGCLETASSGTALGRLIAAAALPATTTVEELLAGDDAVTRAILEAWARPLRAGIDSIAASFDPQCVILGGGLGAAACRALAGFPAVSHWYQYEVRPAALGARAGVIGAALAALEQAT
jgi:glucokinase